MVFGCSSPPMGRLSGWEAGEERISSGPAELVKVAADQGVADDGIVGGLVLLLLLLSLLLLFISKGLGGASSSLIRLLADTCGGRLYGELTFPIELTSAELTSGELSFPIELICPSQLNFCDELFWSTELNFDVSEDWPLSILKLCLCSELTDWTDSKVFVDAEFSTFSKISCLRPVAGRPELC